MIQTDNIPADADAVIVNSDETDEFLEFVDDDTSVLIQSEYEGFMVTFEDAKPSFVPYKHLIHQKIVDLRAAPEDIVVSHEMQAYPWEDRTGL